MKSCLMTFWPMVSIQVNAMGTHLTVKLLLPIIDFRLMLQVLYESSQTQLGEMQAKLDSQKKKRHQLEEEVSSCQAHIVELTAILKSAVRSNSMSSQAGVQSPRSAGLSREGSAIEVGPRLRSKELQGNQRSIHALRSMPPKDAD